MMCIVPLSEPMEPVSTLVGHDLHADKYLYDGKLIVDVPGEDWICQSVYTIERERGYGI